MQVLRLCLAVAYLLVWDRPAMAADPQPPPGQVEHVPPEEALAILGSPVTAPDGKEIGRLVDVLVDATGTPEAGVIDVGGFMGVGARKIAVHWSVLHFAPANAKQPITLDLTLDQLKAAPEYRNPAKPAPVVLPAPAAEPPAPGSSPASGAPGNNAESNGASAAPAGGPAPASGTPGNATAANPAAGTSTTAAPDTASPGSASPSLATRSNDGPAPGLPGAATTVRPAAGSASAGGETSSAPPGSEPVHQTTPPRPQ
jgi:hypothetical protein